MDISPPPSKEFGKLRLFFLYIFVALVRGRRGADGIRSRAARLISRINVQSFSFAFLYRFKTAICFARRQKTKRHNNKGVQTGRARPGRPNGSSPPPPKAETGEIRTHGKIDETFPKYNYHRLILVCVRSTIIG